MTTYQILCLCGIPSIVSIVIGWLIGRVRTYRVDTKALMLGLQAVLRDRLLQSYKHYTGKGYADTDDRMNWENMYTQYHSLGANGVMDDIRLKFLALPTAPKGE